MATLYDIKPAFQARLRPLTSRLAAAGVTANQVTLAAAVLSIVAGAVIAAMPTTPGCSGCCRWRCLCAWR